MRKKSNAKLVLNRETIRALDERSLGRAQGGSNTTTGESGYPTHTRYPSDLCTASERDSCAC